MRCHPNVVQKSVCFCSFFYLVLYFRVHVVHVVNPSPVVVMAREPHPTPRPPPALPPRPLYPHRACAYEGLAPSSSSSSSFSSPPKALHLGQTFARCYHHHHHHHHRHPPPHSHLLLPPLPLIYCRRHRRHHPCRYHQHHPHHRTPHRHRRHLRLSQLDAHLPPTPPVVSAPAVGFQPTRPAPRGEAPARPAATAAAQALAVPPAPLARRPRYQFRGAGAYHPHRRHHPRSHRRRSHFPHHHHHRNRCHVQRHRRQCLHSLRHRHPRGWRPFRRRRRL